ncbi:MAG TPA: protein kinase [Candidatus Solibacter sp.]|nr:protein kinase [Candidatus Solibacter sp.]
MLNAGAKLGPYEIQSPLGAGGMGEVYRARDTRLDRIVAIKIIPSHLSSNIEARQRFDREARTISSLSHPNICHLYDVGSQDGTSYLVMEYLEGETLADRLRKGPMPIDHVLKYGAEICDGLERAHKSGVIHRDLKPGNIMLTKSGAKLMDFGLAKPLALSAPSSLLTQTVITPNATQQPLTTEGAVVGTFQYMSPEQLEGKEADVRSDIFSLGAVLYEMVTGRRAFDGATTASTIAAVMASEPPAISSVQPLSPVALESTVKGCLAKDPDERLQTAHDLKLQLQWIKDHSSSSRGQLPVPVVAPKRRDRLGWIVAAALFAILVAGSIWWARSRPAVQSMYFNSAAPGSATSLALAPDGHTLALVAYSPQASKNMLWMQQIGGRSATVLPGTEGAAYPFWSPDGRSLGFFAQGKLKTIDVASGRAPQALADAPFGRGGAWNKDGVILFTSNVWTGLSRISSSGGTVTRVTKEDPAQFQVSHRWPVFLPDGRHYLYLACNFSGYLDKNFIVLGSLDSDEKRNLVNASTNAIYAEPGYLLFWRDNSLVAQHFDLSTFSLSGEPHILSDAVLYLPQVNYAVFTVAAGNLVAQNGGSNSAAPSQLTWFDRTGKQLGTVGPLAVIGNPRLSPDQRRVAVNQTDLDGRHINPWIYEIGSNVTTRLTFTNGLQEDPVWSPDGKKIVYSSNENINFSIYSRNTDGSGGVEKVLDLHTQYQAPWDWSRDGKYLMFRKDSDLLYMSVADHQTHPLIVEKPWPVRNAQFSPDGKYVAYTTQETGTWDIYISPFPDFGGKWQVSSGGGEEPRWRGDGKELFYLTPDRKLMAVPVKSTTTLELGTPVPLFVTSPQPPISALTFFSYDVSADGQKFLINTKSPTQNTAPLSIILNWPADLEK